MCRIRIIIKYGIRDPIKDTRVTAINIEKSSSLESNIVGMKKIAKQMINNFI
jgi:hypothetical protein